MDGSEAEDQALAVACNEKLKPLEDQISLFGEGQYAAIIPVPVIAASLQARFRSRQDQPFGAKVLAAMRNQFGGHAIRTTE